MKMATKAMRKRVYNTWYGMLNRQTPKGRGRGRYVDPEWAASFETFVSEVGFPKTNDLVLCLHDPDAGFTPGNVYWGTRRDLQQYVKHARTFFFNGEMLTVSEAARRVGIHRVSMRERLDRENYSLSRKTAVKPELKKGLTAPKKTSR